MKTQNKKQVNAVRYFDYSLLTIVIFLVCYGLIMLYSTSSYSATIKFNGNSMYFFKRQAIISAGSIVVMLIVAKMDYHRFAKLSKLAYAVSFVLMALVWVPGIGIEAYGARRWIRIPGVGMQMQPAEVTKVAVILFIPLLLCKISKKMKKWIEVEKVFLWGLAAGVGVFVLTDNLSTAIIVMGMVCIMIFVAHPKTGIFVGFVAAGTSFLGIALLFINRFLVDSKDFRLRRILVWLHPEAHLDDGGFQVMQGLYAIGSGGFFGKGLGNSTQKMIIPEVQNDMILAIICEELGVFGALILLTMFGILLYRLIFIAQNAPDMYGSLMVTGIFAHIALQVVFNVCVVLGVIPTTGITLPFVSYGGTSVLFLMIEMGIALSVSNRIEFQE